MNERANGANDSYRNALADKHLAKRAGILIAAGVKLPPADWKIPESTMAGVERAVKNAGIRIDKQMPVLEESDRHFQTALAAGLALVARTPHAASNAAAAADATDAVDVDAAAAMRDELQRLMPVFASVSRALDELFEISVYGVLLQSMVEAAQQREEVNENQMAFIRQLAGELEPMLQRVEAACSAVLYPFDSATGEITLSQYLFGHDLPEEPSLNALVRALRLMDVLPSLKVRLLGRFAQMSQAAALPISPR
jgi:hypothetical protein